MTEERTYGHLSGIAFERTGTLGKGADRQQETMIELDRNQDV